MNRTILQGDVLEKLAEIPAESIDCIISSPPYWGLRDYGVEGQFGLEPDFRDFLKTMQKIMDQLKRVLKKTGSCWINLGDSYGTQPPYEKSRMAIPERFYIDCIDNGWIARNHIPWYKSNSMPSSVKDRFTNKWESIFFFAKEKKYYFNLDAVREETITESKSFNIRVRDNITGLAQKKLGDKAWTATDKEKENYTDERVNKPKLNQTLDKKQDSTLGADGKPNPTYKGFNERWNNKAQDQYTKRILEERQNGSQHDNPLGNPKGKNPGDVFFINPKPFAEAHFATFPVDLPLKILKCACPNQVCKKCGKPRYPISKPTADYQEILDKKPWSNADSMKKYSGLSADKLSNNCLVASYQIMGYTDCGCNAGWKPGIVLDPFFGAGSTGVAAEKLGLQWMGIDLNPEYIEIARKRLAPYQNKHLMEFA